MTAIPAWRPITPRTVSELGYKGLLRPGEQVRLDDDTVLLIGDVNPLGGVCTADDSTEGT